VRLVMVSLALMVAISFAVHGLSKRLGGSPLHCHLIAEQKLDMVDGVFPGVFELRNDAKEPIAIEYLESMTEHLSLDISDPAGKPVPKEIPNYGDLYWTPRMPGDRHNKTRILRPGEKYRVNILLFGQVTGALYPRVPGKYTIQAVFKWGGKEFKSDQVTVEVQAR
jgi:hypothetical protein